MHAVDQLYLYVEVVGCPTICRHCWARGVGYQAMPVGDVAFVLEQAHRFCDEHGLAFGAYPMHEVAAHPQAPAILRLFADHVGAAEFQPLTTTGVPLATRPDWAELLTAAAQLGTTTVWVAVLARALAHGGQVWGADTLWFDLRPLPEVSGLAARHGNPRGRAVHFTGASARYLWLDRAQHAVRA